MNGGVHVLLDVVSPSNYWMKNADSMEVWCKEAVTLAGAKIIHSHWHRFGEDFGVTGVLLLAESHLTAHTYPEHNLATFDIYMCGNAAPGVAIHHLMNMIGYGDYKIKFVERRGD